MNEVLKQRLVGALILLALGVVFWPIIFVDPTATEDTALRSMPPSPTVDTRPIAPPDQAGLRASPRLAAREDAAAEADKQPVDVPVAAVAEPLPEPEPAAPPKPATAAEKLRAEPPAKPQIDAEGVPVAWMLQVASVSSPAKADDLRDRLLAMGHKAYSKKIRRGERNLWRVYIGPKFEKAKLESIRSAVDAELGVQTMVMRYYP